MDCQRSPRMTVDEFQKIERRAVGWNPFVQMLNVLVFGIVAEVW